VILYELADDFCHVSTILSADFLRVTACNASHVLAIIEVSICLSVCLSVTHLTLSKRCKLGSRNLHCGLPQGL